MERHTMRLNCLDHHIPVVLMSTVCLQLMQGETTTSSTKSDREKSIHLSFQPQHHNEGTTLDHGWHHDGPLTEPSLPRWSNQTFFETMWLRSFKTLWISRMRHHHVEKAWMRKKIQRYLPTFMRKSCSANSSSSSSYRRSLGNTFFVK